jgi:phospholipase C
MHRPILLALALALTLGIAPPAAADVTPPPIKHVFVIVLENKGYAETFGPGSQAPYLSQQLTAQGQLLSQYYGTAHQSLANYIAMVSGQAPNTQTQSDCQVFTDMLPGTQGADGQAVGQGCVYPAWVRTIADQLSAKGLSWKGYMEDMGTNCRHPAFGQRDDTQTAKPGDQYAARHNPFVYFHSLLDSGACAANDVPLDRLATDLAAAGTTPSYSFITPNLCHDGHDQPCVDGQPGGLQSADAFLQQWVPRIQSSPAYAEGGLIVITFDEAESNDASACCNEQSGPNTTNPGGLTPGPGGGRTGAVLLSQHVQPGSVNKNAYNHYSLLRSLENVFGLTHLGYANQAGLKAFGNDVYAR